MFFLGAAVLITKKLPHGRLRRLAGFLALGLGLAGFLSAQDSFPSRSGLNRQLPAWLTFGVELRFRGEHHGGLAFEQDVDDTYWPSRLRFSAGVAPVRDLGFFIELQDARAAGAGNETLLPAAWNPVDLRQAYVRLGHEKKRPWDLRIGRQEMSFGDHLHVGLSPWSNLSRSFDAVKLAVHKGKDRVDLFAASPVVSDRRGLDKRWDGQNLHGVYGSVASLVPGGVIEPYLFYRTRPRVFDERGRAGDADTYTAGGRFAGTFASAWDYEVEMARQFGHFGEDALTGWVGMWTLGHTFKNVRWSPRLFGHYGYASGDAAAGDGRIGTFDQQFGTNHRFRGITDQIGLRNMQDLRQGVVFRPASAVQLQVDHHFFWLASRRDALYLANGTLSVPAVPGGASSGFIGNELDLQLTHRFSPHVLLGAGAGRLFSGGFLEEATAGADRMLGYLFLEVRM